MESDDSDKDRYQPEDQEGSDTDEVESKDEVESEKEEVVSKKGKKPETKPGRREIAAIRTTVPTTGSKSAVEHSKRRERSPRSVPWNLCIYRPR